MPKVTELFALVAQDKDENDEGVIAAEIENQWYPLVGADLERIRSWIPIADEISKLSGKDYKILHFKLDGEIKVE